MLLLYRATPFPGNKFSRIPCFHGRDSVESDFAKTRVFTLQMRARDALGDKLPRNTCIHVLLIMVAAPLNLTSRKHAYSRSKCAPATCVGIHLLETRANTCFLSNNHWEFSPQYAIIITVFHSKIYLISCFHCSRVEENACKYVHVTSLLCDSVFRK